MYWSVIALLFLVKGAQSVCWSQTGFDCTGTCDDPSLLCAGAISPGCQCYDPGLYPTGTPSQISWKHGLIGKILHDKAKVLLKGSIFNDILQQIPLDLSLLEDSRMLDIINQALADVLRDDSAEAPMMCRQAGCCWNKDLGCFGCDGWKCQADYF